MPAACFIQHSTSSFDWGRKRSIEYPDCNGYRNINSCCNFYYDCNKLNFDEVNNNQHCFNRYHNYHSRGLIYQGVIAAAAVDDYPEEDIRVKDDDLVMSTNETQIGSTNDADGIVGDKEYGTYVKNLKEILTVPSLSSSSPSSPVQVQGTRNQINLNEDSRHDMNKNDTHINSKAKYVERVKGDDGVLQTKRQGSKTDSSGNQMEENDNENDGDSVTYEMVMMDAVSAFTIVTFYKNGFNCSFAS